VKVGLTLVGEGCLAAGLLPDASKVTVLPCLVVLAKSTR